MDKSEVLCFIDMKNKIKVNVPESMDEVKIKTLMQYYQAIKDNEDNAEIVEEKSLEIFCGVSPELIPKMQKKQKDEILTILGKMLSQHPSLKRRFMHKGVEYGFHPILDEMTTGEFIDACKYAEDGKISRLMAVLFRPITDKKNDRYNIEPYAGTEKYHEVMEEQAASLYLGVCGFFLRLGITLSSYTLNSMKKEERQMQGRKPSAKSGVGTA